MECDTQECLCWLLQPEGLKETEEDPRSKQSNVYSEVSTDAEAENPIFWPPDVKN